MLTAEVYRRLAQECERDAARASSVKIREEMLTVASMWRELAEFKQQARRQAEAA